MRTFGAILIGSVHLLATVVWLGGAIFADQVLRPEAAKLEPPQAGHLGQAIGARFTIFAWSAAGVLLLTGILRAAALGAFSPDILFATAYGYVLLVKILFFLALVVAGILILRAGRALGKLSAGGGVPQEIGLAAKTLRTYQLAAIYLGIVVVVLAVSLRALGLPEV